MGLFDIFKRREVGTEASIVPEVPRDPNFLGEYLVYAFLENKFGITEAKLNDILSQVPEKVRSITEGWIRIYLCWFTKMCVKAKYGDDFVETMFLATKNRLEVVGAG